MNKLMKNTKVLVVAATALTLSACGTHYITPGGPADLSRISSPAIRDAYVAKPEANFPASIAIARIQAPNYRSHYVESYGKGEYSVITARDFEQDADIKRLQAMPKVAGVATLNRLLIPAQLKGNEELREAAAKLQADILIIYTIDTGFFDQQKSAPLALVTLGFLPTKNVRVSSTAAALLMDVRSGFIYGAAEDTQKANQFASSWTTETAVDETRMKTERAAFNNLIGEIEKLWPQTLARHAT